MVYVFIFCGAAIGMIAMIMVRVRSLQSLHQAEYRRNMRWFQITMHDLGSVVSWLRENIYYPIVGSLLSYVVVFGRSIRNALKRTYRAVRRGILVTLEESQTEAHEQ